MPDNSVLTQITADMAGNQLSYMAQANLNRKMREWNEKMYGVQRADALADWKMQNEYNSPSAMMARLKAAGLNPNLVYGHGTSTEAGSVRSTNMDSWSPTAPRFDFSASGGALFHEYDLEMKQAQIDNLKAQNTVSVQDSLLKAAQTQAALQGVKGSEFDLQMKNELKATSLEYAMLQNKKVLADTKVTLAANERAEALKATNLSQAIQNVLLTRKQSAKTDAETRHINVQIENAKKDGLLKDFDVKLTQQGIRPGDPIWWRAINSFLERLDDSTEGEKKYRRETRDKGSVPFKQNPWDIVPRWLRP